VRRGFVAASGHIQVGDSIWGEYSKGVVTFGETFTLPEARQWRGRDKEDRSGFEKLLDFGINLFKKFCHEKLCEHCHLLGFRLLLYDGPLHHGIGILPTIPVSRTRAGIAAGRDEQLERAIQAVKKGGDK
jgi:hypothetical protein